MHPLSALCEEGKSFAQVAKAEVGQAPPTPGEQGVRLGDEHAPGTRKDVDEPSASPAGDESFAYSDTGSIVYHATSDSSGVFDSSFDSVDLATPVDSGADSSFEIVGSEGNDVRTSNKRSSRAVRLRRPRAEDEDDGEAVDPLVAPASKARNTPGGGLLNPAAPTFAFHTTDRGHSLDQYGTSFDDIVMHGKDGNGELTVEARAALSDLGLKSIPAMHGPLSLPYARCPSGIDAFLLPAAHEEGDPYPFIIEPDAPLPRRGAPPLPGNARFAMHGRSSGRFVSAPAVLEREKNRAMTRSDVANLAAAPSMSTGADRRRKPAPLLPPGSTVTPQSGPSLAEQNARYQMHQAQVAQQTQQAQLAYQAHVAQEQLQLALAYAARAPSLYPFLAQNPLSSLYGGNSASPTSPITPLTAVPLQQQFSQPPVQPYGVVSTHPAQAHTLAAQLQHPAAIQQARRASLAALGLAPPALAQPAASLDHLALLQLAAQQQQQPQSALLGTGGQSSRASSYQTAAELSGEDEAIGDPAHLFYPSLNLPSSSTGQLGSRPPPPVGASAAPDLAYLQRRRQSAAPSIPHPGGRKPSLAPAVDVGPRRASIAPQARLGKEQVPPFVRPSQSRRPSIAAVDPSAHGTRLAGTATAVRQPSQPNLAAPSKAKKGRVFSEVGNTLGVQGGKRPEQPRHASETAASWRRTEQANKADAASSSSGAGQPKPPSPLDSDAWDVVEHVAEALVSLSTGDTLMPAESGDENMPTPRAGTPMLETTSTADSDGAKKPAPKRKNRKPYWNRAKKGGAAAVGGSTAAAAPGNKA
ncbi:hypothetical protein JCM10207_001968 [Rhodosporidiobolus poonsookiae]